MTLRRCLLVVLLLPVLLRPDSADACYVANQVRLIVLGGTDDVVLALELDQYRNGELETGKKWHFITPRLVALTVNSDGAVAKRRVLNTGTKTRLEDGEYDKWLRKTFDRTMKRAEKQKGFVPAKIIRRVDCMYLNECEEFALKGKGLRNPDDSVHAIGTPKVIEAVQGGVITEFDGWGIEALEFLQIGSRLFVQVTLGVGWDMDPCAHAADPNCSDDRKPRESAIPETVRDGVSHKTALHHGTEWDAVVAL
jgi:hypothetical protein